MTRETHTPKRSIRVPDEEWDPAAKRAAAEGRTVTSVIRAALRAYVAGQNEITERSF